MSKSTRQPKHQPPTGSTQRLVVWGERRPEPDWDAYVAALLAYALREVEGDPAVPEEGDRD